MGNNRLAVDIFNLIQQRCGFLLSVLQQLVAWHSGTVVERRSLAGELSLSCVRPAADG